MILQALVEYYEALAAQSKIAPPGWSDVKVSFALYINDAGELERTASIKTEQQRGNKTVLAPQTITLPAPVKRTVGVMPNFLYDNSNYILGVDAKGKPLRSRECFASCRKLHQRLLQNAQSPAAKALLAFFQNWQPEQAYQHPALQENWEEILAGANLIFRYDGDFIHNDPEIRQIWQNYYDIGGETADNDVTSETICLVTGQKCLPERTHPNIKGLAGAQSSGAALVSFNADAFCSYGKEQSINAPTGKYAAFAYTTALNYLLADREHLIRLGSDTVLFWAQGAQSAYQSFFSALAFNQNYTEYDLQKMLTSLCRGEPVEFTEDRLSPNVTFYVLILSPNAARISVRLFLRDSFGGFLQNIRAHYERLAIVKPNYNQREHISLSQLLDETVNPKAKDKSPSPNMAGETLRAILSNTQYPATILNNVTLRIRAERNITPGQAAIIKAYYLKNTHKDVPKEVLTEMLNPDSNNIPYVLGRLFSVLEDIQSKANPGLNTTIKDKYFNSASATPSHIFPTLLNLTQKHLAKLETGWQVYYNKQLGELLDKLAEEFPVNLNLQQQGSFQLGYYHQTQARYQKKEAN